VTPADLLELGKMIAPAIAVYAGVRADLSFLKAKVESLQSSADEAHKRIDKVLERL
jgi:hypothetical protein